MTMDKWPETQRAVQLVAGDELRLNAQKPVPRPAAHQILAEVQAVGLCFSDLKLLKQFSQHPRKSDVISGVTAAALSEMPNYVPGNKPAVPGHEAVVRVVAIGEGITDQKVGDRFLVQTDYRWLPTGKSNAAFGYNFEGALQEYVLMDDRVITSPDGESMLIPVPEDFSASAIALVEPWACVENAYAELQRQALKVNGRCLAIGEAARDLETARLELSGVSAATFAASSRIDALADFAFDDVLYFGSNADTVEKLFAKVAPGGIFGVLQCGGSFDRTVKLPIGRVHYGGVRLAGTKDASIRTLLSNIPESAEIRPKDRVNVIGAAGPMGTMHVIRALSLGLEHVSVYAGDINDGRLAALAKLVAPLLRRNRCYFETYNPARGTPGVQLDYIVIMAPVPALVSSAIAMAAPNAIINIFAGLSAEVGVELDLNAYIEKKLYFIGTSGSELKDMRRVLSQVLAGQLDTNLSVAAVSGLDGAIDGIRAVERNAMPGKIIVYPKCIGLPLTALTELPGELPVGDGRWDKAAEEALLKQWEKS